MWLTEIENDSERDIRCIIVPFKAPQSDLIFPMACDTSATGRILHIKRNMGYFLDKSVALHTQGNNTNICLIIDSKVFFLPPDYFSASSFCKRLLIRKDKRLAFTKAEIELTPIAYKKKEKVAKIKKQPYAGPRLITIINGSSLDAQIFVMSFKKQTSLSTNERIKGRLLYVPPHESLNLGKPISLAPFNENGSLCLLLGTRVHYISEKKLLQEDTKWSLYIQEDNTAILLENKPVKKTIRTSPFERGDDLNTE